jgi:hypothetical protein
MAVTVAPTLSTGPRIPLDLTPRTVAPVMPYAMPPDPMPTPFLQAMQPQPAPASLPAPADPAAAPAAAGKPVFGGPAAPMVIMDNDPNAGLALPGTITQSQSEEAKPTFGGPAATVGYEGLNENVGAGLKNGLVGLATAIPWLYQTALNAGQYMYNVNAGNDVNANMPYPNADGGRRTIIDLMAKVGIHDPDQVKANTFIEKIARSGAEAATGWAVPEAIIPRLTKAAEEAGIVGADATRLAEAIVGEGKTGGQVLKDATVAGGFGAASEAANEAPIPEQWKPVVATAAGLAGAVATHGVLEGAPALARGATGAVSDALPVTTGAKERLAGRTLVGASSDPAAAMQALRDREALVPGSEQTTAAASGDMGLLSKERAVAAESPEMFNQRRAEQNAARVGSLTGLQTSGSGESVVSALKDHLATVDAQTNAAMDAANKAAEAKVAGARQAAEAGTQHAADTAQAHLDAIGEPAPADVVGGNVRQLFESARADAKTHERAMWDAVDPTGTLQLTTAASRAAADRIGAEIPRSAKPADGEEAAIFKTASELQPTEKLSEVQALQARVKAAMREERFNNGESPAYRRLVQLNEAIFNDLGAAVSDKVTQDKQAVAAGQMRVEDTMLAKLQREQSNWYAAKDNVQTRATGSGDTVGYAGGGPASVPSAPRAEGFADAGSGDAGGAPRLPADAGAKAAPEASFDQAALDRLSAARGATKDRVETFDNKTLSPIRRRPSTVSPYDMPAANVPSRIFNSRPGSADAIGKLRAAVGDEEAIKALEPHVIDRLHRVAMRDGVLDPKKAEAFLRNHSEALKAFPELEARIRRAAASAHELTAAVARGKETVAAAEKTAKSDTAAATKDAKSKRDEAQSGAIGKIVGAEDHEEVVKRVGQIFGKPDSPKAMAALRRATHGDPAALEGLRKAVVDWMVKKFVSNTEVGTSEEGALRSDQFQTFMKNESQTLKAAGFTDEEIQTAQNIADDLRIANRSITAAKLPGGSNTAQDFWGMIKGKRRNLFTLVAASIGAEEGLVHLFHAPVWGITATLAAGVVGAVRSAGMKGVDDLVRKAMLDPELALRLMEQVTPQDATKQAKGLMAALSPGRIVSALTGKDDVAKPHSNVQYQANKDGPNAPRDSGGSPGEQGVRAETRGAETQSGSGGREADGSLRGLPRNVGGSFKPSSFHEGQVVAERYMREAGLPYDPPNTYVKVDPARAKRIADAYDEMKHDPQDPKVKAAYQAMADETLAQYEAIVKTGMKFEFIRGEDPYKGNPRNMTEDVRNNHHMWVFPTKEGFGSDATFDVSENPLLADSGFKIGDEPATVNDIFRGVHDYFGHVKEGVGFRADGEENAWRSHSSMYSPEARKAMTTETRGQNSWVNYGPHGEANRTAKSEDTAYADQKIGILPDWVISEGAGDEPPKGGGPQYQAAYHGTPHEFDRFDSSKIGTGEGAQAFGHGLYFAGKKEVAEHYQKALSGHTIRFDGKEFNPSPSFIENKRTAENDALHAVNNLGSAEKAIESFREGAKTLRGEVARRWGEAADWLEANQSRISVKLGGRLHEVDIPETHELLDWDAPMSEQPRKVRAIIEAMPAYKQARERYAEQIAKSFGISKKEAIARPSDYDGKSVYGQIVDSFLERTNHDYDKAAVLASDALREAGVPGHRYLEGNSRNKPGVIAGMKRDLAAWEGRLKDAPDDTYVKGEVEARRQELADAEKDISHNYVIYDDSRITPLAKYRAGKAETVKPNDVAELVDIVKKVSGLRDVGTVDTIELPNGAPEWGIKGPTTAAGSYHPVQDVVALAMDSATPRTAYHEAFHRLQNRFLTIQERAVLRGEAERLRGIVGEGADKLSQSELEAEAFAIYSTEPDVPVGGLPGAIRAGWDRMMEAVQKVRNFLTGKGYRSAKSIFDEAKAGNIAKRAPGKGAAAGEQFAASRLEKGDDHPDRISTRVPSLKSSTEDPLTENLSVGLASMKANPTAFEHNMQLVKGYPGVAIRATNPDRIAEAFIDQTGANLRFLYDSVPAKIRDRSKLWYDGARTIAEKWSKKYKLPDYQIAGTLAALSPQKDWFQNVSLAERVLDIHHRFSKPGADGMATPEMKTTVKRIFDKPQYAPGLKVVLSTPYAKLDDPIEKAMWLRAYDEAHHSKGFRTVSPEGKFVGNADGNVAWGSLVEIAKAVKVLDGEGRDAVSAEMGAKHKVRNFYNNILAPNAPHGDVTIDTHAVAAALMRPLSGSSPEVLHNFGSSPMKAKEPAGWVAAKSSAVSGSEGTYGLFAEAYRKEAEKLGILPRELQSITWEAVRGLFTPVFKRNKIAAARIDAIWHDVKTGKISAEEARNAIKKLAGGINPPDWYGPGGRVSEEAQSSSYAGKLESGGVPGRAAPGLGERNPAPAGLARKAVTVAPAL